MTEPILPFPVAMRLLIALLPAALPLLVMYHLHSVALGLLAIPAVIVTVLVAAILGVRARGIRGAAAAPRESWAFSLLVLMLAAAVTGYYWLRVWAYEDWEMLGITVLLAQILGFWWPGVLYAMVVLMLEQRRVARAGSRQYWHRLAAGMLGGVIGLVAYPQVAPVYFRYVDRQPVQYAIQSLQSATPHALHLIPTSPIPPPPAPPGARMVSAPVPVSLQEFRVERARLRWHKRGRHLFLEADLGDWKRVTAQQSLRTEVFSREVPHFVARAEELLQRKDVRAITVTLYVGNGEALRFHRTEETR
ncbi:MAG: hypothetical protein QN167_02065 [Armatimonadota bacterium]|nr:hypothetical protein [Armatimonadota bacterium]